MRSVTHDHFIEIDEETRLLTIHRVSGAERQLYTSVKLPDGKWDDNPEAMAEFCRMLGKTSSWIRRRQESCSACNPHLCRHHHPSHALASWTAPHGTQV